MAVYLMIELNLKRAYEIDTLFMGYQCDGQILVNAGSLESRTKTDGGTCMFLPPDRSQARATIGSQLSEHDLRL